MKKIISVLIIATMILSSLVLAVSANLSEQGTITIVKIDDKAGSDALSIATIAPVPAGSEDWTKAANPDDLPDDAQSYGFFDLKPTDETKAAGKNESAVTISVPGLNGSNSPIVLVYNQNTNKFERAKDIKVNGSEITFTANYANGDVKCQVAYTASATSPATGVCVAGMIAATVVSLFGAAYTGKKAFN